MAYEFERVVDINENVENEEMDWDSDARLGEALLSVASSLFVLAILFLLQDLVALMLIAPGLVLTVFLAAKLKEVCLDDEMIADFIWQKREELLNYLGL